MRGAAHPRANERKKRRTHSSSAMTEYLRTTSPSDMTDAIVRSENVFAFLALRETLSSSSFCCPSSPSSSSSNIASLSSSLSSLELIISTFCPKTVSNASAVADQSDFAAAFADMPLFEETAGEFNDATPLLETTTSACNAIFCINTAFQFFNCSIYSASSYSSSSTLALCVSVAFHRRASFAIAVIAKPYVSALVSSFATVSYIS
mmetsp:Transcript_6136/g.20554  ORF Transcript_6136/g.20554 Transcript_6136/m.20554 type:complete len:206 (+) Transcript_6136:1487-2104(+)